MNRKVIAVDIDDVLAGSTDAMRRVVNAKFGVSLTKEHYSISAEYWGYFQTVWEKNGLAGKIKLEDIEAELDDTRQSVPPIGGSIEALSLLREHFNVVAVTARSDKWAEVTHAWLANHYPGVFSNIVLAGGREGIKLRSKGQLCVDHGAAWLIDDSVEHAHTAIEHGVQAVLFGEYGWHKPYDIHAKVVKCKDWNEVSEYFRKQI